jgi:hypothetical protein
VSTRTSENSNLKLGDIVKAVQELVYWVCIDRIDSTTEDS